MDLAVRYRYIHTSGYMLHSAARSLAVAFALGLYLVLAPVALTIAVTICAISAASLLYGNLDAWQIIWAADTALVRFGRASWNHLPRFFFFVAAVLKPFWSFVIIFGLPAIPRVGAWWGRK
ncbi:hypothetical protein ACP4OV_017075 [Aristida adscensionis]